LSSAKEQKKKALIFGHGLNRSEKHAGKIIDPTFINHHMIAVALFNSLIKTIFDFLHP
jgi:hypothetical protein